MIPSGRIKIFHICVFEFLKLFYNEYVIISIAIIFYHFFALQKCKTYNRRFLNRAYKGSNLCPLSTLCLLPGIQMEATWGQKTIPIPEIEHSKADGILSSHNPEVPIPRFLSHGRINFKIFKPKEIGPLTCK